MFVTWHRRDHWSLRTPSICAVTGEPADSVIWVSVRKGLASRLPGVLLIIVDAVHRPETIRLPVTERIRFQHRRVRALTGVALALLVTLGVVNAVVSNWGQDPVGWVGYLALAILIMSFIVPRFLPAPRFVTEVDRDQLTIGGLSAAFCTEFARLNPSRVTVEAVRMQQ